MILSFSGVDSFKFADAFNSMARARASVFHDRLGWNVNMVNGRELDDYDNHPDTIYLIEQSQYGEFFGSLRLIPTTGKYMLKHEFRNMFPKNFDVSGPGTWECTRFCVHPGASPIESRTVARKLLHGLCKFALASDIKKIVGVYGVEMVRIYRTIGWSPTPICASKPQFGRLFAGLWTVDDSVLETIESRTVPRQPGAENSVPSITVHQ